MSTWNLYDLISAVATGASTGAAYYAKRDATRGDYLAAMSLTTNERAQRLLRAEADLAAPLVPSVPS